MSNARPYPSFVVREGSDCVVRYIMHDTTPELNEIIYGRALYRINVKWKEGGQSMYLQRYRDWVLSGKGEAQ